MAIDIESITPSLEEVASYIPTRTTDRDGRLRYTWLPEGEGTRPNDEQARGIALRAARYIALRLGRPSVTFDDGLLADARDAAAVYAAMTIENGYYALSSSPDDTANDQLGRMARERINALVAASRDNGTGGTVIHSIIQTTPAAIAAGTALQPEQIVNGPDPEDDD